MDDGSMDIELRQVAIHGKQFAYRMAGSGPALLLLHGIAGSSEAWREVMPKLAEQHCVIAPDMLGHGQSAKPIGDYSLGAYASGIRDLLHVLDVERATVVGQSFGGGVALQLAYQHPEICERLVLVDSGGLGREVNWVLRLVTLPGSEYLMPLLFPSVARELGERAAGFFRRHGLRVRHVAESWNTYASLTEAENRQAFIRTVRGVIDPGGQSVNATDKLYLASRLPTLIIWGCRRDHPGQPRLRRPRGHPGQPARHHRGRRALAPGGRARGLPASADGLHGTRPSRALQHRGLPGAAQAPSACLSRSLDRAGRRRVAQGLGVQPWVPKR